MARYRKKPVVIEAEQYLGPTSLPMKGVSQTFSGMPYVVTVHGHMTPIEPGDWIIPEPTPDGTRRYYPCKPDIFEATYELVDG